MASEVWASASVLSSSRARRAAVVTCACIAAGGTPVFADSMQGTTRGQTITFFADNDRLLVDGAAAEPTESRLKRKQKKSGN